MSDQPWMPDDSDPQDTTSARPDELFEKSLIGSSFSEVRTIQTSTQTPEEFVTSEDD